MDPLFHLFGGIPAWVSPKFTRLQQNDFSQETPVLFDTFSDSSLPRFTPSLAEIDSADKYLVPQLTRDTPADRNPLSLHLYCRQYVGFFRDGRKYVFINAACNKPDYFTENT